jgi:dTDP-4-amino-4,6-dideoxygalactose transaminase
LPSVEERVKVPYLDLPAQHEPIRQRLHEALDRVLSHGAFILGPEVAELERRLAERLGVAHVVTCNSGTDALLLAFLLRGIGRGDEVIVPSHSFVATANAVAVVGARPVFADVDPATMCVDPRSVARAVSARTRAVVPVHLNGFPCELEAIAALCERHELSLIEDCAQAIGSSRDGAAVGGRDLGCFSLHPLKVLAASGDGGFVTTTSEDEAAELRQLRNHGLLDRDTCGRVGLNSRLDTLQAAFLLVKLDGLDAALERRRENAASYRRQLAGAVDLPPDEDHLVQTWSAFVIQHPRRDAVRAALADRGIDAKVHYPSAIHQQPAYAPSPKLPATERLVGRILSLPVAAEVAPSQVDEVAAAVRSIVAQIDG